MTGRANKPGEGRSSQPHNPTSTHRLNPANRGRRSPSPIEAASQRPRKRVRFVDIESLSSEELESSSHSHRPRHKRPRSQSRSHHHSPANMASRPGQFRVSSASDRIPSRTQPLKSILRTGGPATQRPAVSQPSENNLFTGAPANPYPFEHILSSESLPSHANLDSGTREPVNIINTRSRVSPITDVPQEPIQRSLRWTSEDSEEDHVSQEIPQHPIQPSGVICANCNKSGHTVRDCVTNWSPAGDIPGCYRCNDISHTIDSCLVQPRYNDATRYQIEVVNRAGRPPLRSIRGWNQLAVAMNHQGPGPIGKQFMTKLLSTHFDRWNYELSGIQQFDLLVNDSASSGLEQIKILPNQGYLSGPENITVTARCGKFCSLVIVIRLPSGPRVVDNTIPQRPDPTQSGTGITLEDGTPIEEATKLAANILVYRMTAMQFLTGYYKCMIDMVCALTGKSDLITTIWQSRNPGDREPHNFSYHPIDIVCANCRRHGHALQGCVTVWDPSGDIPGCYLCNVLTHTIDNCPKGSQLNNATRYQLEVVSRIGRPPLRSTQGWNRLAVVMNHQGPGPISRKRMATLDRNHFHRWNYDLSPINQRSLLVEDPTTHNSSYIRDLPDQGYFETRPHES
ncbi:uncharacterized protein F4817DRAFT_316363 [Daldinia loculata]|uniref:uncharacterized protein n=1 Tax=Daldinia loculata TaxID=103429 RepID=UPI0020C34684|nr:uncharacterized protein F4817DRAFT_316363 [Daldinia loculata]KAI1646961.1 hypothetical protein F4817DRAFT_316363 [Daldinia loculata]